LAPNNTDGPAVAWNITSVILCRVSRIRVCLFRLVIKLMSLIVAESFSVIPSSGSAYIVSLDIVHPHHITKPDWAPAPNTTTNPSHCLNLPRFFVVFRIFGVEFSARLILAPARTWHPGIGLTMWEQARARAEEIGSMVLWCDGGEGELAESQEEV